MDESVWIEVVYDGKEPVSNLREALEPTLRGSKVEGLKYSDIQKRKTVLSQTSTYEKLEDLNQVEVFQKRMELEVLPAELQATLLALYQEVLRSLDEKDSKAQ
jgi:exonuclease SbcD